MSIPHNFSVVAGIMGTVFNTPDPAIPAGVITGRIESNGILAFCENEQQEQGGPAEATATLILRAFHGSQDNGSFVIQVYTGLLGSTNAVWYNQAGTSSPLFSALQATPPTVYYNSVTPVAIRFEISTNGGGFVDQGWTNIPNVGDQDLASVTSFAEANSGSGRIVDSDSIIVRCYGRAAGYSDTLLVTFELSTRAIAESDF